MSLWDWNKAAVHNLICFNVSVKKVKVSVSSFFFKWKWNKATEYIIQKCKNESVFVEFIDTWRKKKQPLNSLCLNFCKTENCLKTAINCTVASTNLLYRTGCSKKDDSHTIHFERTVYEQTGQHNPHRRYKIKPTENNSYKLKSISLPVLH